LWLLMLLSFCLYLTQRYAVIHIVLFSTCLFQFQYFIVADFSH
jgi:hypothetical protein